jgi:hypothetical protein
MACKPPENGIHEALVPGEAKVCRQPHRRIDSSMRGRSKKQEFGGSNPQHVVHDARAIRQWTA